MNSTPSTRSPAASLSSTLALTAGLLGSLGLISSCGLFDDEANVDVSKFPEITAFSSTPTQLFIVDEDGKSRITRTQPMMGSQGTETTCQHNGAHIHFEDTGADYTINIVAPVAGTISLVDTCKYNGENDKYDIWLAFAQDQGDPVRLLYSIEPMAGNLCSGGDQKADNGTFAPFIFVEEGETVEAGQVIAQFVRKASTQTGDDSAHIHFALRVGDETACPNLFDSSVRAFQYSLFDPLFIPETCRSLDFSEDNAFCINPSDSEWPF